MTPTSLIPTAQHDKLMSLTEPQRKEVLFWCRIVSQIESAKSRRAAFGEIARQHPGIKGMTASNIKTKYYAWQQRGWRAFINGSKLKADQKVRVLGDAPKGQPPEFVEYWKALQENFQRSSRAAYRELVRRYRCGDDFPGIGNWRSVWMETIGGMPPANIPIDAPLPDGWSERNLSRYRPSKFELTATRIGVSAAAKFRPLVYTTRAGLLPGQIYVFDDVWHDNKVNYIGINRKAMRPLEFSCLDIPSGCQVAWGAQPMLENEATGRRETLRETEMRFLLCHVLCNLGYHPSGCALHVEHGTAAIRPELAEQLFEWTGGAVTVARGGISGKAAHDGFFMSRGKGNSRFKACLESHHNLKHNELAALPGQVGKDRDHSPEEGHGRDTYNNTLIKAMSQLPAERAQLLQLPYLDFSQWKQVVGEIYERINGRIDHHLEGWEQCGYVTTEYRLSEAAAWEPMTRLLGMPPERREKVEALIDEPGMVRTRRLSPAEVWLAGRANLVRLGAHYVPLILGYRNAKHLKVGDDHQITFQDRRLGPGIHRYLAQVETEHGELRMLEPGQTYCIYATPFDTSAVFVADQDNRFLGIARAVNVVCKADTEAIHREIGKSMHIEKQLLAPVKARHAAEARQKSAMHSHNANVMMGASENVVFTTPRPALESDAAADDFDPLSYYAEMDETE
jgi:hypothetical protein